MKLSEQDAVHFFHLMWALQFFTNQRHKIHNNINNLDDYLKCTSEEKIEIRQILYSDRNLFDTFVQENPQNLSAADLSIISGWKDFVTGEFYIERLLKKYAVFIQEDDVYGVLGLHQGFDELVHPSRFPLYVRTVLLPFKGKIIYDGIFHPFNIYFGTGIKRNLKETYMRAKQNNRIVDSFEPRKSERKEIKILKNWKPELNELANIAKRLKGSSEAIAIQSPAFSLIRASIEFSRVAESEGEDLVALYKSLKKVERALKKSYKVLNRQEGR